jgi:hypothetical protein
MGRDRDLRQAEEAFAHLKEQMEALAATLGELVEKSPWS